MVAGIFPFGVRTDARAIPVGTAFCFSKLGLVASAYHVLYEALRHHPRPEQVRAERWLPEGTDVTPLSFDVLHRHKDRFTLWPLRTLQGAKPTDIILAHPHVDGSLPFLALPMTFDVPRIGARVRAVGYGGLRTGEIGLSTEKLLSGDLDELRSAGLTLHVREGTVTRIFTKRFARGFVEGACFEIECETLHGMSGGPVFNESGYVCGMVAAGAGIYSERGGTIVSLLYPLVFQSVRFEAAIGPVTISSEARLIELVTNGAVETDRSEEAIPISVIDAEQVAGLRTHRDDSAYVFDDLHGALSSSAAEKVSGPVFQVRRLDQRRNVR